MKTCDVIVIGGGPAGLAAAASARKHGAENVLVLERDNALGGILNQCIHDGFGLRRYQKALTGPEYAIRSIQEAKEAGVQFGTGCMVTDLTPDRVVTAMSREGLLQWKAGAVILSTGCRERTRGNLSIPGPRPAGIYTAGVAQNLVNCRNLMIGRRILILGSGDIGLIMARRLTLEGAEVLGVVEILPDAGGLTRNVSQCVLDYGIPFYLSHTVSRIVGKQRLEAVEIAEVDADKKIIPGTEQLIECDTLVLSVGLIPENEVAKGAGVILDPGSNRVLTDEYLQTNLPGVFSCGNSHNLSDLVDDVSQQGEIAGLNAARFLRGEALEPWAAHAAGKQHHGVPKPGSVICPLCPNGCEVVMDADGTFHGNTCPRGAEFARLEQTTPVRMLTTTMRLKDGGGTVIPVRSDRPVRKQELRQLVQTLHDMQAEARTPDEIRPGQVLASSFGITGAEIIAAHNA